MPRTDVVMSFNCVIALLLLLCTVRAAQAGYRLELLGSEWGESEWDSLINGGGRSLLNDGGRSLLQAKPLDCKKVHKACRSCRTTRIPGTKRSELVCSVCEPGWRLRRDGKSKTCDCNPGMSMNASVTDAAAWCTACPNGQFCPGGDLKLNPNNLPRNCSEGLATVSPGAKSEMQCFTQPGYGRVSSRGANGMVQLTATLCEIGTFNVGRNTAGCQRCNPGLTTTTPGATTMTDCVAPPGSYYDRGMGRLCQRGTYSANYTGAEDAGACEPCSTGVTTEFEGSNSSTACSLAKRGYFMFDVEAGLAQLCPVNTYKDTESSDASCTPCPTGLRTLDEGADGLALCLAPPGYELKEGAESISECEPGYYKEGWNRNPCVPCGEGLITASPGAVSKDACLVPAGWGLESFSPLVAKKCTNNSYGDSVPRPAVSSARCLMCSPNMFTLDVLNNVEAAEGYTREQDCKVAPGWGTTNTQDVVMCPVGTYNAGGNRLPCQPCAQGFTTLGSGKVSDADCVLQPGWAMDTAVMLPKPCDRGTYSIGGTAENPNGECVQCRTGLTTQEAEATSEDECNMCQPGFGQDGCTPCPHNTFSQGGLLDGQACQSCATGSVSARMTPSSDLCYPNMQLPNWDVFRLSNDSYWQTLPVTTSGACSYDCAGNSSCIMYRFGGPTGSECQVLYEDRSASPANQLGFKLPPYGMDYALYAVPAGLTAGKLLSDEGDVTLQQCIQRCTWLGACEVISFPRDAETGSCKLFGSEMDVDYTSMWHVEGTALYSDRQVPT